MQPRMSDAERDLLTAFLRRSRTYLEFGTGGSTVLAAKFVESRITSVDSSVEWLDKVRSACTEAGCKAELDLVFVDIGPTRDWGYPTDSSTASRWPAYHEAVWERPHAREADFCLVDGRFRVACFLQALLHCRPGTPIAIHDFDSRPGYHIARQLAREVAMAEDLSVFLPRADIDAATIREALAKVSRRSE
jgi:hypothetical protein